MDEVVLINNVFTGTDGFLYIFLDNKVVRLPMNDKDYDHTINYMTLTREGIKLKTQTTNEKEIKLKKAYHYLHHRRQQLLDV